MNKDDYGGNIIKKLLKISGKIEKRVIPIVSELIKKGYFDWLKKF